MQDTAVTVSAARVKKARTVVNQYESQNLAINPRDPDWDNSICQLISFNVSKLCSIIESAVSKYHGLNSRLNSYASNSTQHKAIMANKNKQRVLVDTKAKLLQQWLAFGCQKAAGSLHSTVESWCRADGIHAAIDAAKLLREEFPWRNVAYSGYAEQVSNLRLEFSRMCRAHEEICLLTAETMMAYFRCGTIINRITEEVQGLDTRIANVEQSPHDVQYCKALRASLLGRYGLPMYTKLRQSFHDVINGSKPHTPRSWAYVEAEPDEEEAMMIDE